MRQRNQKQSKTPNKKTSVKKPLSQPTVQPEPTLLAVGHGNYVFVKKLIGILNSNSSPMKRLIQEAKKNNMLINATHGRHNRSVLFTEAGYVILSALNPETISLRFDQNEA